MNKSWWKSKTVWFNVLTVAADYIGVIPLPPGTAIKAAAVINILLRFVTTTPISVP